MRRAPVLAAAAVLAAGLLSGCAAQPSAAEGSGCDVASGKASDAISASGAFGKRLTVRAPSPLHSDSIQRTVLRRGDGQLTRPGDILIGAFTQVDAQTGRTLGYQDGTPFALPVGSDSGDSVQLAFTCVPVGSRIAVAAGRPGSSQTIAVVVDLEKVIPGQATGDPVPARRGFPGVVVSPGGRPGVVRTTDPAPTATESEVLKQGDGKRLANGDDVFVHALAVTWSTNTVQTNSWEPAAGGLRQPFAGQVGQAMTGAQQQSLPQDISRELAGRTVGSQLVVVVPSSRSDATTWVIDILGTP